MQRRAPFRDLRLTTENSFRHRLPQHRAHRSSHQLGLRLSIALSAALRDSQFTQFPLLRSRLALRQRKQPLPWPTTTR
jgi:hypothetical protein